VGERETPTYKENRMTDWTFPPAPMPFADMPPIPQDWIEVIRGTVASYFDDPCFATAFRLGATAQYVGHMDPETYWPCSAEVVLDLVARHLADKLDHDDAVALHALIGQISDLVRDHDQDNTDG
jgi:hypothetical protein